MSSSKLKTVEEVMATFPNSQITRIEGRPDYESLKQVIEEMCANAASVPCSLGDGTNGYIHLCVSPVELATITSAPTIEPTNPTPVVSAGLTAAQLSAANRAHDQQKAAFQEIAAVKNALRKCIVNTVEEKYIRHLRQRYTGYAKVVVYDIIRHLLDTYANITTPDLEKNTARMQTAWDPNEPPEVLFHQVQEGVAYADHGKTPFTPEQIVNMGYTLVFKTGVFADD